MKPYGEKVTLDSKRQIQDQLGNDTYICLSNRGRKKPHGEDLRLCKPISSKKKKKFFGSKKQRGGHIGRVRFGSTSYHDRSNTPIVLMRPNNWFTNVQAPRVACCHRQMLALWPPELSGVSRHPLSILACCKCRARAIQRLKELDEHQNKKGKDNA